MEGQTAHINDDEGKVEFTNVCVEPNEAAVPNEVSPLVSPTDPDPPQEAPAEKGDEPETVTEQPQSAATEPEAHISDAMKQLATMESVKVEQALQLYEAELGCEHVNRYDICTQEGEKFMTAKEDHTHVFSRLFCCRRRPFDINIMSSLHHSREMFLTRDFHCQGCLCPCSLQSMDMYLPATHKVATIKEIHTFIKPRYEIVDTQDEVIFKIEGPVLWCGCSDIEFKVCEPDGKEVGSIVKHWGGVDEMFGGVNDFSVYFRRDEKTLNKAILVGATFLVDFMYYERK